MAQLNLRQQQAFSPPHAFSWDDLPTSPSDGPTPSTTRDPSPPLTFLPAKDMKTFGLNPLRPEYGTGIVRCKHCRKPILRSALSEHVGNCDKIRALPVIKKSPSKAPVPESKKGGTKRKATDEPEGAPEPASKKKKAAPKVTKGRFKGPIDYDKQCGVINDKGLPCSRSLTCKSHAMGAKRAVPGRSKPYNDLLLEWNRLNNPNWVEPVKRETKKEKKEKKDREREEKKKLMDQKKAQNAAKKSTGKKGATAPPPVAYTAEEAEEDVDSEVELDSMVKAIRDARNQGRIAVPMAVSEDVAMSSWFVVRREKVRCCRDQLLGALMGTRGGIAGVPSMMRP